MKLNNIKNIAISILSIFILTKPTRKKLKPIRIVTILMLSFLTLTSCSDEEDNMDILVNEHMRDITRETRPQMSSAGLSVNNKHFRDLSNHELHKIKKMHMKEHSVKPKTILDESLGDIMNKLVNFLTFSFEGYTKAVYEAEVMEDVYDDDKSIYQSIKVHLIAIILFMRDDQNILYIGILLIFISMIMYLMNITTS